MNLDLDQLLSTLETRHPELVAEIRERRKLFPYREGDYLKFLQKQWLEDGGKLSELPVMPSYQGLFPFPPEYLWGHGLVDATTGSGKTTLVYANLCGFIESGTGLLVPDYQGDYKCLGVQYPDSVIVLSLNDLMINPMQAYRNETYEQVASRLTFNLREDFIRDASDNIAFEEVINTLTKYKNPTLYHFDLELARREKKAKQRDFVALQTLRNRIRRKFTEARTFNCRKGFPLDSFRDGMMVIDVRGHSISLVIFVLNHIILALLNNSDFSDKVRTVFILEEAQLYINRQRENRYDLGEPIIYQGLRLARKIGLNFLLVSQTLANFSSATLGNVNLLALGKLTNGPCVRAAAMRLSLNDDQIKALQGLPQRSFIVVTPENPEPKLLEVPHIEKPRYEARELAELTKFHLSRIPFEPFDPRELEDRTRKRFTDDDQILPHIYGHPFMSSEERERELDMHPESMRAAIARLEQRGLVKMETVSLGTGRPRVSAILTPKGYEYLHVKPLSIKGGLLHKFYVSEIQRTRKNPCITEERGCDLVEHIGNQRICYEVETDAEEEHILANLRRDLEVIKPEKVVVVVRNQNEQKTAKRFLKVKLDEETLKTIVVNTIQEVLHE